MLRDFWILAWSRGIAAAGLGRFGPGFRLGYRGRGAHRRKPAVSRRAGPLHVLVCKT